VTDEAGDQIHSKGELSKSMPIRSKPSGPTECVWAGLGATTNKLPTPSIKVKALEIMHLISRDSQAAGHVAPSSALEVQGKSDAAARAARSQAVVFMGRFLSPAEKSNSAGTRPRGISKWQRAGKTDSIFLRM
jgi:hypothetical protein